MHTSFGNGSTFASKKEALLKIYEFIGIANSFDRPVSLFVINCGLVITECHFISIALKFTGNHGDSLIRENHNGYLAALDCKKTARDIKAEQEDTLKQMEARINKKMLALELQQAAMCQVFGKFISALKGILPQEIEQVTCIYLKKNLTIFYFNYIHTNRNSVMATLPNHWET